jgi:hypothetical protein
VTRVIRLKVHTKKPQNSIPNKSNIEGWNWKKKSIIQEDEKQKRSIKKLMIKIKIKNKSNCFFFEGKNHKSTMTINNGFKFIATENILFLSLSLLVYFMMLLIMFSDYWPTLSCELGQIFLEYKRNVQMLPVFFLIEKNLYRVRLDSI